MTYLEAINKVLVRLRLPVVTDLTDSYTLLIGQFVNQAKEEVEDAGPWHCLRSVLTNTTTNGLGLYVLDGANHRSYVLKDEGKALMFEVTTGASRMQLEQLDMTEMTKIISMDAGWGLQTNIQRPNRFAIAREADSAYLYLYPLPQADLTYQTYMVIPEPELDSVSDTFSVPSRPVWMLAAAYAAGERGEELSGVPGMTMLQEAQHALHDAIMRDFGDETNTFRVG